MIMLFFFISMTLSVILLMLNSLMGIKSDYSREKLSAFECGFDPKSMARLPFSLHFFLIALIFLIFDVEITILLPIPPLLKLTLMNYWDFIMIYFVLILIFGTLVEWVEGSLDWSF